DDVLDDDDAVAVLGGVAHCAAALAVVLHLFAVEEIGLIDAVVVIQGDGAGAGQGNALIGRAEHGLELAAHGVLHQLGIVAAQAGKLGAGFIVAGVHKVLGVPAALGDKV